MTETERNGHETDRQTDRQTEQSRAETPTEKLTDCMVIIPEHHEKQSFVSLSDRRQGNPSMTNTWGVTEVAAMEVKVSNRNRTHCCTTRQRSRGKGGS